MSLGCLNFKSKKLIFTIAMVLFAFLSVANAEEDIVHEVIFDKKSEVRTGEVVNYCYHKMFNKSTQKIFCIHFDRDPSGRELEFGKVGYTFNPGEVRFIYAECDVGWKFWTENPSRNIQVLEKKKQIDTNPTESYFNNASSNSCSFVNEFGSKTIKASRNIGQAVIYFNQTHLTVDYQEALLDERNFEIQLCTKEGFKVCNSEDIDECRKENRITCKDKENCKQNNK